MDRAERRRSQRMLGYKFPKMQRTRPVMPIVVAAVQAAVRERIAAEAAEADAQEEEMATP